jgi:hypothetical protein
MATTRIKRISFGPIRPDTKQRRCSVTIFREGPGDFVVEAGIMRGDARGAKFERDEEWTSTQSEARKLAAKAVHRLKRSPMCQTSSGLGRASSSRRSRRR